MNGIKYKEKIETFQLGTAVERFVLCSYAITMKENNILTHLFGYDKTFKTLFNKRRMYMYLKNKVT